MILGVPTLTFFFMLGFPIATIVLSLAYVLWYYENVERPDEDIDFD
jgi:hypothetical protein